VKLDNVTREDWIVGGFALLMAICLVAFPWFSVGAGPISFDLSATDAPDGWLGVLAFIAALAVLADLAVERLAPQTQVPAIGGSRANTRFILAVAAAAFTALKFLLHIHFSDFGWGFYFTVLVTAGLVYFALQARAGAPAPPPASPPPPPAPSAPSGGSEPPAGGVGSTPPPAS
jgi:hypothetical protein